MELHSKQTQTNSPLWLDKVKSVCRFTVRYAVITLLRCRGRNKIVLTSVRGFSANKLRAKTDVTNVARILSNKSRDNKWWETLSGRTIKILTNILTVKLKLNKYFLFFLYPLRFLNNTFLRLCYMIHWTCHFDLHKFCGYYRRVWIWVKLNMTLKY